MKKEVYVIGDAHGDYEGFHTLVSKLEKKKGKPLDENDVLIIAGDAGFVFDYDNPWFKQRKKRMKNFNKYPFSILVVLGNHENYDEIYKFSKSEIFGMRTYKEYGVNIHYIENGEKGVINGKTFWFYGGGLSIDKYRRDIYEMQTGKKVWWEQEIDESNFEKGKKNFENVDYVITHDIPDTIFSLYASEYHLQDKRCSLQKYFDFFYKNKPFIHWYSGHYHPEHKVTYRQNITILPILAWEKIKF